MAMASPGSIFARLGAIRAQAAPIAAISVFGLALTMAYPLLGLLLERMGASGTAIGLNTTAASLMMVIAAPLMPRILARVGLGTLMIGSGLTLAVIMISYPLFPDYWFWMALRAMYGFCGTAIFFASEYWIVAKAPEGKRGRVVAVYAVSLSVSFMLGPLIVSATGVDGILPFAIGSALLLLGLAPIFWGLRDIPERDPTPPPPPLSTTRFFVTDPSLLFGVVLFGIIEYGTVALLPVWGVRSGFSEAEAAIIMASFAGGSLILQPLIGWAADRYDRRRLLLLAAAFALAAPLAMAMASHSYVLTIITCAIWGGVTGALYTVALTELGYRYKGTALSEGNAAVVLAYGLGALFAPLGVGAAMDLIPPDGLLYVSSVAAAGYVVLLVLRMRQRPDPVAETPPETSSGNPPDGP